MILHGLGRRITLGRIALGRVGLRRIALGGRVTLGRVATVEEKRKRSVTQFHHDFFCCCFSCRAIKQTTGKNGVQHEIANEARLTLGEDTAT